MTISIIVYHLNKYVNICLSAVHLLQVWHSWVRQTYWFDRRIFMQNFWIQAFSVRKFHLTSLGKSRTPANYPKMKKNSLPKKAKYLAPGN